MATGSGRCIRTINSNNAAPKPNSLSKTFILSSFGIKRFRRWVKTSTDLDMASTDYYINNFETGKCVTGQLLFLFVVFFSLFLEKERSRGFISIIKIVHSNLEIHCECVGMNGKKTNKKS